MQLAFAFTVLALLIVPVALAALCWLVAGRIKNGWIAHFLFAPTLLGGEWFLLRQLLITTGENDGDGGFAGAGLVVLPLLAICAVTLIGYHCALGAAVISRLRKPNSKAVASHPG